MNSALPDFQGDIWFVVKQTAEVGIIDSRTEKIRVLDLPGEIQNSFTVVAAAVYVATSKRMYRLGKTQNGKPTSTGAPSTATTADQARPGRRRHRDHPDRDDRRLRGDRRQRRPENVVVYRTAKKLNGKEAQGLRGAGLQEGRQRHRELADRHRPLDHRREQLRLHRHLRPRTPASVVTEAGFARVDIRKDGKGCRKVWTNSTVRAPSVVPKMSAKTGLIYTYTRPPDPSGSQGYYWTAIDFRTRQDRLEQVRRLRLLLQQQLRRPRPRPRRNRLPRSDRRPDLAEDHPNR